MAWKEGTTVQVPAHMYAPSLLRVGGPSVEGHILILVTSSSTGALYMAKAHTNKMWIILPKKERKVKVTNISYICFFLNDPFILPAFYF